MKSFKQFLAEEPTTATPHAKEKRKVSDITPPSRYDFDFSGKTKKLNPYDLPPGVIGTLNYGPPSPDQTDHVTRDPVPNTDAFNKKFPQTKRIR